jgi:hypothetical protein
MWECKQHEPPMVLLLLGTYVGDSTSVDYRFDATPPALNRRWGRLTAGNALFMGFVTHIYNFDDLAGFTRRARTASKVLIRVTDLSDGETLTYTVALSGFTPAYNRLPCGKAPAADGLRRKRNESSH